MTIRELKKYLRRLAYHAEWSGNRARLEKTRYKCIGRQMAYQNAVELLELLELDIQSQSERVGNGRLDV